MGALSVEAANAVLAWANDRTRGPVRAPARVAHVIQAHFGANRSIGEVWVELADEDDIYVLVVERHWGGSWNVTEVTTIEPEDA